MKKHRGRRTKKAKKKKPLSSHQPLLSICMIVRDEERYLPDCLRLARQFADEIILVDTGSTDKTVEIARKYGANVYHFEWNDDFSAARNESLRHARGKWIIWLDADDRIFPDQHEKIRNLKQRNPECAFSFIVQGRGVDEAKALQCRMFPNRKDVRFCRPIHEEVASSLEEAGLDIIPTDILLIHVGYATKEIVKKKKYRNNRLMKDWLAKHPEDYLIRYQYALCLHTLGEHGKAIQEILPFFDSYPDNKSNQIYFYALILLGRCYLNTRQYQEALSVFSEAQKLDPNSSFLLISKGEVYASTERYQEAYECLSQASDTPDASLSSFALDYSILKSGKWALMGKVCLELGMMEKAFRLINRAIDLLPHRPEGYRYLAEWYQKNGDILRAIENFQLAAEKSDERIYFHYQLGECYFQLGELAEARKYYRKALEESTFPDLLHKLARTEQGCGNYEKALEYYLNLQNHFEDMEKVEGNILLTYLDQKRYDRVKELLSSNQSLQWASWVQLLLALYEQRYDEFEEMLFVTFPQMQGWENEQVIAYLLEQARQSKKEQQFEQAELILRLASFFEEKNPDYLLKELLEVQIQNQRIFQGIATLEQRIQLAFHSAELVPLLSTLGECYKKIGVEEAHLMCQGKIAELQRRVTVVETLQ